MALTFDHAVIAVDDLDVAIEDYRALGFTVKRGGVHANGATHNALVVFLDGTYLELLARTGEPPTPGMVDFSTLLENGEGLVGYALRCDDIEAEVARLKGAGFTVGEVVPGERRRDDGTIIQWKLALIEGGFAPFLIQDVTPRERRIPTDAALTTHANRAVGIKGVEIVVREMVSASEWYHKLFGKGSFPEACGVIRRELRLKLALEMQQFLIETGSVANFQLWVEQEHVLARVLGEKDEALYAVYLVREQGKSNRFTLERTHRVQFEQLMGVEATRGDHILAGLNDVDWRGLDSGWAITAPEHLRELVSDDADVRSYALDELHAIVNHQMTIFDSSLEVIPFLLQLIHAPEIADKDDLLDLLDDILGGTAMEQELQNRRDALVRDVLLHDSSPEVRALAKRALE